MAIVTVSAVDQDAANAHVAHLGEGDLLRAVGHAAIIPLIAVGVKQLSNGCLLALANSLACCRRAQKKHSAAEPTILRNGSRCALNEHVADLSARAGNATTLPNPNV
jgi:hypothetical protein